MNKAYIQQFTLPANSSGQYVLSFTASLDSATISGIEVLPVAATTVGKWTPASTNAPATLSVWAQLQVLTDGSVLVGDGQTSHWYKLTPDPKGHYATGTWSQVASSNYARGFTPSMMLKNGKYLVEGGEYVLGTDQASVDIYDPVMNTWTAAPSAPRQIGDTAASMLPDGRFYTANDQDATTWIFNPYVTPMTWTQSATLTIAGSGDEQGFMFMQTGKVIDTWTSVFPVAPGSVSIASVFDVTSGAWTPTKAITVQLVSNTAEIGPASLLYSGKVFQPGSVQQQANGTVGTAATAIYDPSTNNWTPGPSAPDGLQWGDTSADVMINGDVINATAKATTSQENSVLSVWEYNPFQPNGGTFTKIETQAFDPTAPNAFVNAKMSFPTFLQLPTGEVLVVDGSTANGNSNVNLYMPSGGQAGANYSWRPTLTSISSPSAGNFTLTGAQLNGLTTGATFGDDRNSWTNYPIIWLQDASSNIFYARTHDFDQMTPRPATAGLCQFTLPTTVPNGSYQVWASANGVQSSTSLPLTISGNHVASISGPSVAPGTTATWTVTLAAPASGSTVVNLTTDNASVVSLGATSVTVPSGQTTATVTVTGHAFGLAHISAITAVANAQFPAAMGTYGWSVDTLSDETSYRSDSGPIGPSSLNATKTSATWDVNIVPAAPSGGVTLILSSTDPGTFVVPATVTVPAGSTKASFNVTLGSGSGVSAQIQAALYNTSKNNSIKWLPSITVTFQTGDDVARADSELQLQVDNQAPVCLKPSNTAAPNDVCPNGPFSGDQNGNQSWNIGTTDGPQVFPLSTATVSNMNVTLISHDNGSEPDDIWDIQSVSVFENLPNGARPLQLNIPAAPGNVSPSNCVARLKGAPNATTVTFTLDTNNGHVYENGTSSEVGQTTTCTNNGG